MIHKTIKSNVVSQPGRLAGRPAGLLLLVQLAKCLRVVLGNINMSCISVVMTYVWLVVCVLCYAVLSVLLYGCML